MFEIDKLTPSRLTRNIVDNGFDLRPSRVNLVEMNALIIDCHKIWSDLPLKKVINLKEIKPTLNTGLKASNGLQPF